MGRILNLKGNKLLVDAVETAAGEMVGTTPDAADVVVDDANFDVLTETDGQAVLEEIDATLLALLAGKIRRNAPVTATGTDVGTAAALLPGFQTVSGANGTVGVVLPTAPEAGTVVIVKGITAGVLKVYPDAAATINAIGSNGAISLASGAIPVIFVADSTTQWYTIPLVPS